MNTGTCMFEYRVVSAVKTGQWADELRAHVDMCPLCSNTVTAAAALLRVADETAGGLKPVGYRILWLRARFMRKQERLSKMERFMMAGLFGVGVLLLAGIALWKWQIVLTWITNGPSEPVINLPLYIFVGCAALVWLLTEEVLFEVQ